MDPIQTLALTLGAGWASGINLYAAVFVLGWLGASGDATLPASLQILSNPLVMGAAGCMYLVEFFVDKTPGADTGWDLLHTFIRIPAGAVIAAGMSQGLQVSEAASFAAFLVGGGLAATSHAAKTGSRILINASPTIGSGTITASLGEDLVVIGGLWTALHHPWLFLAALMVFLLLLAWLLPRLWRAIRSLFSRIGGLFGRKQHPPGEARAADGAGNGDGDPPRPQRPDGFS
jgi:hypothetical protein